MSDHIENELKFTSPNVHERDRILEEMTGLYGIIPHTEYITDCYSDTEDLALYRQGIIFRIRSTGMGTVMTLKLPKSADGGMFSRREIEYEVGSGGDMDPQIERIFSDYELTDDPVLTNITERAEFVLEDMTVCLDYCSFVNENYHFLEIEAEAIDSDVILDGGLADIIRRYGFVRAEKSKYERGIELIRGHVD